MNSFFSRLETRINTIDSLLCVGLDPHGDDLPENSGQAARDFCLRLIEQTADVAVAYKPNAAFFEVLGPEGIIALKEVIRQIPEDIPVILDIKRGDISSTADAYARAAFEVLKADAVTINPYLGRDSVLPFINNPEKGAFVLCKTSNPGAAELQDLVVSQLTHSVNLQRPDRALYEWVADFVRDWNIHDNLGLVIGATQVESLARVRQNDPRIWILAPGIGAQGGNLQAALRAGLRTDGMGMLIPVSRAISRSADPRQEAQKIRKTINSERFSLRKGKQIAKPSTLSYFQQTIASRLLDIGCIQFGQFKLKSGNISPVYLDLRKLTSHPDLLLQVGRAYWSLLEPLDFDHLAALPYAGMPVATAVSLLGNWSMIYPRKEEKSYGTKVQVEGVFSAGETAVVIDDLITTGGSKLEAIKKLTDNGLIIKDIVVLIDRSNNARVDLKQLGYQLHAFLTLSDLLTYYQETDLVEKEMIAKVRRFLNGE